MALMKQATLLAKSFSDAAKTHQTVEFASHIGSIKAQAGQIDSKAAPLKALYTAMSGMLSQETQQQAQSDAAGKSTTPGEDKLPHSTDPIIAISAKGGLGITAGQDLQMANGETVSLMPVMELMVVRVRSCFAR